MDKRQLTTIMYLTSSTLLVLAAAMEKNPWLIPTGLLLLILGGFHSQNQDKKV